MVLSASDSMKVTSDSTLVDIMSLSAEGIDLIKEISNRYSEDPFFEIILTKLSDFRNFEVKSGLIYLHKREILCIPKVIVEDRSVCEIVISEAHSLLAEVFHVLHQFQLDSSRI